MSLILPYRWPQKPPLGVPLDREHPLAQGLVGCWLMNEGSGSRINDLSGNGFALTLATPIWSTGKFGPSIVADGTTGYAKGTVSNWRSSDYAGTISAWIKPTTISGFHYIFSSADEASTTWYFGFRIRSSGVLSVAQTNNDTTDSISAATVLTVNKWYHVVLVSDGLAWTVYLDGKAEALSVVAGANTGDWFADTANRDNLLIGGIQTSSLSSFIGNIGNLQIWNRALTGAEVRQLHAEPFAGFTQSQIKFWGVAPAAGGLSIPAAMHYNRMRRAS